MISGRGLGHTGGTLDKLASIPGYDTAPDLARFRAAVRAAGCAIVGQTADLAPADRRLYAIRDVTATADSLPLITASILSKKLAAGLDALVMDVKVGSGALLPVARERDRARREPPRASPSGAGLPTVALLTDMSQPLGHHVGNALEVREAIDFLTGRRRDAAASRGDGRPRRRAARPGRPGPRPRGGRGRVERALASGAAAERFARMVAALGRAGAISSSAPTDTSPRRRCSSPSRPSAPARSPSRRALDRPPLIAARRRPAARRGRHRSRGGPDDMRGVGDAVGPGRPIAVVHARSAADAAAAAAALREP